MMIVPPKKIIDAIKKCEPWEIYDESEQKVIIHPSAPESVKIANQICKNWIKENYPPEEYR